MQTARFGGFAAIVFDAYGTLFDVDGLDQRCAGVTDRPGDLIRIWRMKQLEYAVLRTVMDRYADWGQITSDALDYAATALKLDLGPAARRTLTRAWLELPAFPDVPPALDRLAGSDLRLLILSNGTRQMLDPLIAHNGLTGQFSSILTSESVQTFKPDPSIYYQVTEIVHARINEILFVSSNGFDVAGAKSVGFTVCRVDRRGDPLDPLGFEPDLHVRDLGELAHQLLGNDNNDGRKEG
ncbi:MAG TPA: haloacid dehalogenase type II [Thermomicrobiales bacterium]|nr:haloacid dehalogenase type II [Thermomicrobiales bacterium]